MNYVADFETTTDEKNCHVWIWGSVSIHDTSIYNYGYDIESFLNFFKRKKENSSVYFHNLKFDGGFIIPYLLQNGYTFVKDRKQATTKTFTCLISDMNVFYSIEIYFNKDKKHTNKLTIYDSLKLLPFSVDKVAKAFKLPLKKLKIDYDRHNTECEITQEEIDYLYNDNAIVAKALNELFTKDLTKMTTASNALNNYKSIITEEKFKKLFPVLPFDVDHSIRLAYKGGWTYLKKGQENKVHGHGIILDVNSLYPSRMYFCPLPYGEPLYFIGEYQKNKTYPLYVQKLSCFFKLKKNHLPTIQLKNYGKFCDTEYLENSNGEYVTLTLSSVDLELFFEHYEVTNIEYIDGFMFRASTELFKPYIDVWIKEKNQATIDENDGLRTIAKLMLNSLYGKFALNPKVRSKIPQLDENGIIHYVNGEQEIRDSIYIPIGVFITAYARSYTIKSAQKLYDRFLYADTDSLHLLGLENPSDLEIDNVKLGAWKKEGIFYQAKYIKAKRYIERIQLKSKELKIKNENKQKIKINKIVSRGTYRVIQDKITCAGLSERCYSQITFKNFKTGANYSGNLKAKNVKNGVVLIDSGFIMR
jgi:hypothetical protein